MRIFARATLADGAVPDEPALLLEGSWPSAAATATGRRTGDRRGQHPAYEARWSLDDSIDARYAWIDKTAAELAAEVAGDSRNLSAGYLNELALRYFFVKLLRVVAFFEIRPLPPGEGLSARLVTGRDESYAALLREIAEHYGASLNIEWRTGAAVPCDIRQPIAWRRWAARALPAAAAMRAPLTRPAADDFQADGAPRVVLCGNPRILNPICGELIARRARVWWLHDEFAVRSWWHWRRFGVGQLTCDWASRSPRFDQVRLTRDVRCHGIRLNGAIDRWLGERLQANGGRQAGWIESIARHFCTVRPTAIVLDEDATPLKRAAIALARRHGASSIVAQHGAPCGRFGFSPLAADKIGVWGAAAREQLRAWKVPDEQIAVVGWPGFDARFFAGSRARIASLRRATRFLLLATVAPNDSRPDTVEFHLTGRNHEAMIEMACAVVAETDGAQLTVKLHPRAADGAAFERVVARWPRLRAKIVRRANLSGLLPAADCVLSCASTAGIEAALAGAPVVQLLPEGSGNVLPDAQWGLIGSARTKNELRSQIATALERGWVERPTSAGVAAETGRTAAARVVDAVCRGEQVAPLRTESHSALSPSLAGNL